eukprot:TRINITY_DN3787_c0_g1_i1.p1 TRINITY_DN3787_c0_g1~~TRINITY_DN3787_c0_g1_i1.p1  ORF type:complete len:842 (+),score=183.87 TRINITY_DN3787_c0_g1_i1:196-2721(+)
MKFTKQLEEYQVPEWKEHYLNYKGLKKSLEEIDVRTAHQASVPTSPVVLSRRNSLILTGRRLSAAGGVASPRAAAVALLRGQTGNGEANGSDAAGGSLPPPRRTSVSLEAPPPPSTPVEAWRQALEADVMRVAGFVENAHKCLRQQLCDFQQLAESLFEGTFECCAAEKPECSRSSSMQCADGAAEEAASRHASAVSSFSSEDRPVVPSFRAKKEKKSERQNERKYQELHMMQACQRVSSEASQLRAFVELNHVALFKILKKHDKRLGCKTGLQELLPKLMEESGLGDQSKFDSIDEDLRGMCKNCSCLEGFDLKASHAVLRMAAGVQSMVNTGHHVRRGSSEKYLFFFLGSSVALFVTIILLIMLPYETSEEKPFNLVYFLAPFPVFRFGLSTLLTLWGMGTVAHVCNVHGINHMFLLNVDPRCRVGPEFFFVRAAILTTVWIVVFGMYIVDYKWMLFPQVHADKGVNPRSSSHFVIYPLALMIVVVGILVFWPSKTCRRAYRLGVLATLGRTAMAPLYMVSFADNVAGDVLTSLPKPLQDIPPMFCYFLSQHPQTDRSVRRFSDHGDTCPTWVHKTVKPFIAGAPFWFRLMQCARRYYDTREFRHLMNFGKYACSLLVVIVSSVKFLSDSDEAVISVGLIATVYAFVWDVSLDWGLTWKAMTGQQDSELGTGAANGAGNGEAESPTRSVIESNRSPHQAPRIFGGKVYLLCVALDLLLRLTWVITLMQVTVITNDVCQREMLLASLSAFEIFRRSMWAILRIEYEQVANAGGFRALLWVPRKAVDGKWQEPNEPLGQTSFELSCEAEARTPPAISFSARQPTKERVERASPLLDRVAEP